METKKDYSYGVVPVRKEGDQWMVFVLHQIARTDTYWTFPKGHAEEGETHEATALRELQEEAGLVPTSLETARTFDQAYQFTYKNEHIDKYVSYYIGYIAEPDFIVQKEEVVEARWCTFKEARVLLTYDLAKELLDHVQEFLADK